MTTLSPKIVHVLSNWGKEPEPPDIDSQHSILRLNYLPGEQHEPNVNIALPDFFRGVYHLSPRILDLLELAAYVFCADRSVKRGSKQAVEYQSWSRSFQFHMRVRDYEFWSQPRISQALSATLEFMTGDRKYGFTFYPGHSTPPADLFDTEVFQMDADGNLSISLFSGGLDSLAGAIERLNSSSDHICLVSHQSQPGTKRTQRSLVEVLKAHYPGRVSHYRFGCSLRGVRAQEETQRTRAFLYTSIAFAIAQAYSQHSFLVYENGTTSINFARREDLGIARASRTTHPQTIWQLERFFSLVAESDIKIEVPYLWKTKTEVIRGLMEGPHRQLIPSSVSCGRTFQAFERQATQCGVCSQCIDRRLAAYAANADHLDDVGIYQTNFITEGLDSGKPEGREAKTMLVDYLRQARSFATGNADHFARDRFSELADLIHYLPGFTNEIEAIEQVWELCRRHGAQVLAALERMRSIHENIYQPLPEHSLLKLISDREFLRDPVERLVSSITSLVEPAIPHMFRNNPPANEPDFNAKINAFLQSHFPKLKSEHPTMSFACAQAVSDHSLNDILIESKYIRQGTPPSRASEGMAADLTKYSPDSHILFLVYDPDRAIHDDNEFRGDFESRGRCTVCILR